MHVPHAQVAQASAAFGPDPLPFTRDVSGKAFSAGSSSSSSAVTCRYAIGDTSNLTLQRASLICLEQVFVHSTCDIVFSYLEIRLKDWLVGCFLRMRTHQASDIVGLVSTP